MRGEGKWFDMTPLLPLVCTFGGLGKSANLTQGWKETSSKRRGFTKLIVRSGMPLSFTLQSEQ